MNIRTILTMKTECVNMKEKKNMMKIQVYKVEYQIYLIPYIKITHNRFLNGNYEFIIGWFNREITISI